MASLRQHYESIRGNRAFIGGALGIGLSLGAVIGGQIYTVANEIGAFAPKPTGKYARAIEIEEELNGYPRMGEVDLDGVGALRTELDTLNGEQEVIEAVQETERKGRIAVDLAMYTALIPCMVGMTSARLLSRGNRRRQGQLNELLDR